MKKLNLKDIQQIELSMLLVIDEFCRQQGLRYYLVGGTLLGAIRHKGFIPWDDDIDIGMPRPDFEKFVKLAPEYFAKKNLSVQNGDGKNNECPWPYCEVRNLNTLVKRKYTHINQYLWLDVLVVDGLPADEEEVKKIYRKCRFYRKIIQMAHTVTGEGTTPLRKLAKYILKPLARLYGDKRALRKILDIAQQHDYESSEYVGIVTCGLYDPLGERMLKKEFEVPAEVEFEGHRFSCCSCWDSYLSGIYGNYMQLPPPEKRKAHDVEAYLLEEREL